MKATANRDASAGGERWKSARGCINVLASSKCNNNCVFCMERGQPNRKTIHWMDAEAGSFLSGEALSVAIDKIKDKTLPVIFTSSEPTLHPQISSLIAIVRARGFADIQLQSNARMLGYRPLLLKLALSGVKKFLVSIHGSRPEIHDAMTRTRGSFSQTMRGIRAIVGLRSALPHIGLRTATTVTKINYRDIPGLLELLLGRLKVNHANFNTLLFRGNALKYADQLAVRYTDALSVFNEAVKTLEDQGLDLKDRVGWSNLPHCVLPGNGTAGGNCERPILVGRSRIPPKEARSIRALRDVKCADCAACAEYAACPGVPAVYLDRFGWEEFKPLKRGRRAA